jgi:hypothetical protein
MCLLGKVGHGLLHAGPLLEQRGRRIGIVQAIAAPAALLVTFVGDGGHAGSQLMHLRCRQQFNCQGGDKILDCKCSNSAVRSLSP